MTLQLHTIKISSKVRKSKKRVGRGNASGRGTYSTRGMKGQRSRSGGKGGLKLKGLKRNLLNFPKFKGMKSGALKTQLVSLSHLNKKYQNGDLVTPQSLLEKNIIDTIKAPVKVLNNGEISIKLEIKDCLVSAKAIKAIEKAGGKVVSEKKIKGEDKKENDKKDSEKK